MPSTDNRTKYFLHSLAMATQFPVKQSFLDAYPIVKATADNEFGESETIFYTEADGLTHFEALSLSMPQRIALIELTDGAPINHGSLSDNGGVIPEGVTHLLYALPNVMDGLMELDMWQQWQAANTYVQSQGGAPLNPKHFLLTAPKGGGASQKDTFLATGELPA